MRMVFPIFLKLQCNIPKLRKTCSLPSWQPHHRNASGHLSPVPVLHVPHLQTQGLTLPTKHKASHMSEGRLAGLKTLLTKHVPMGISQRVYFTGITYFHLFVPFLLFGFFFLILPPWAGHRKSLISFPLLCWHRFWSQCRGWRDACCFQWEEDQAQSCRCYSCKYSAPPFISHTAPCSTT